MIVLLFIGAQGRRKCSIEGDLDPGPRSLRSQHCNGKPKRATPYYESIFVYCNSTYTLRHLDSYNKK